MLLFVCLNEPFKQLMSDGNPKASKKVSTAPSLCAQFLIFTALLNTTHFSAFLRAVSVHAIPQISRSHKHSKVHILFLY